ncbi:hypothetical protein N7466_010294 [Penicillium verhagenii]|uniref:uncharacterized protein n=1 Tax=Penicillium verhagenii TaxID=1562060 RepID=UPI002544DED5|nr:uncharacterized protein N7466_010294 [Penicillium verhagenii]KAJ5919351.1 hypothetical protein N7466_010294 [Penicillium verhagenii]
MADPTDSKKSSLRGKPSQDNDFIHTICWDILMRHLGHGVFDFNKLLRILLEEAPLSPRWPGKEIFQH